MGYRSNVTYTMTRESFDELLAELARTSDDPLIKDEGDGEIGFSENFDDPELDERGNTVILQWRDAKWYVDCGCSKTLDDFVKAFDKVVVDADRDYSYLRIGENYNDIEASMNTGAGELEAIAVPNTVTVVDFMDRIAIRPGDYVCYTRRDTDHHELGVVKRRNNTGDGWFVWYSAGETAANTPDDLLCRVHGNIDVERYANVDDHFCTPEMLGGDERLDMFG